MKIKIIEGNERIFEDIMNHWLYKNKNILIKEMKLDNLYSKKHGEVIYTAIILYEE